tara:strand:+ start:2651 stop:4687 length:2037 start_codon:yes stop_codon:yes gene_type:complete
MCGIFGVIINKEETSKKKSLFIKSLKFLGESSQSRGKDSSGLCVHNQVSGDIDIFKGPIPANQLLKSNNVINSISAGFTNTSKPSYVFGHARLVTNGTQLNTNNNQPVQKNNIIGVHNGIIVNVDKLWEENGLLEREYEIDTEVLFALVQKSISIDGLSLESSVSKAINNIQGTVATAFIETSLNKFVLATNYGSLYTIYKNNQFLIFASEQYILKKLAQKYNFKSLIGVYSIEPIKSGYGLTVDLNDVSCSPFSYAHQTDVKLELTNNTSLNINHYNVNPNGKQLSVVSDLNYIHLNNKAKKEKKLLEYPIDAIKVLKRCKKCILPETFPFIYYDEVGICNYCYNYKKQTQDKSIDKLMKLVEPYRRLNSSPDVLLPFSGGRDSSYVLHIVKNELGLNPITFTYDWGMVTDLARRNIARVCGKLGIENIIVAANLHWKRKNIKQNILAWLKNPELGMIPLFMAGDKYFFYYAYKVKKQLGIDLEIWGVNRLENTDFKTGFSGIKPQFDKKHIYSLSLINQLKLFSYVGKNVLKSPGYLNQSVFDSIGSLASRYFTPKNNYFHLFDFIEWNEDIINKTILDNYDWEKAADTESTWRIGDGTASFYNYIYTLVVGFSENDTFRSNQIREGIITREKALELIFVENKPRYNSLKWYLEIIGLDYDLTIKKINSINRFYNE